LHLNPNEKAFHSIYFLIILLIIASY